jgi:hypothetical protein
MWDLCNQYVAEGQLGGLATFICFIALICICFSKIGTARKAVEGDRDKEWYFWLLGVTLFSHIVAFFGISYFDQTRVAWFALLAMIQVATAPHVLAKKTAPQPARPGFRRPLPAYAPSAWRSKRILPSRQQPSFKSRLT